MDRKLGDKRAAGEGACRVGTSGRENMRKEIISTITTHFFYNG
jgi:hypothetical protein